MDKAEKKKHAHIDYNFDSCQKHLINEVRRTVVLTMHQKRRGGDFIATVLISECGGLFDGGEMFGGGRRVNMAHLDSRRR